MQAYELVEILSDALNRLSKIGIKVTDYQHLAMYHEFKQLEAGWVEVVPPTPTEEEIAQQQRDARIWELKDLLAQGDYKIIKCAEAQLTGEAMPYDIEALVAERNAMRAEINELEATNNQ